jgi:hypothetical protein
VPAQDPARIEALAVRALVAHDLRDPDSAKFRDVRIVPDMPDGPGSKWGVGVMTYCGEVNGKNAFGAYAGFKHFAVTVPPPQPNIAGYIAEHVRAFVDDPSLPLNIAWDVACKGKPGTPVQF